MGTLLRSQIGEQLRRQVSLLLVEELWALRGNLLTFPVLATLTTSFTETTTDTATATTTDTATTTETSLTTATETSVRIPQYWLPWSGA